MSAQRWGRTKSNVQKQVLDRFHNIRLYTMCGIVWLAIRLTGYELTFNSVRKRNTEGRTFTELSLESTGDLDGLLAHARNQVTDATARRVYVTDKCKTLFTFNTALLALIAIFQSKAVDLYAWEIALFYLAILAFVVSLLVVWTYFDVGGEIVNQLEQEQVNLGKDNLKKHLINENLRCATDMSNRTDFLVDLYRTSRFFLMSGFVLLFIVFSHNYFARALVGSKPAERGKVIMLSCGSTTHRRGFSANPS